MYHASTRSPNPADWRAPVHRGSLAAVRIAAIALYAFVGACSSSVVSRDLGARCDLNSECNGVCLMSVAGWPGGMCSLVCDSDAACPSNAACINEQGGVCAFRCMTDADCAFLDGGYTCKSIDRHAPDTGQTVMVCHG
jgi:hypothetical protein